MTGVREVSSSSEAWRGSLAALYLGRSRRDTSLIHSGRSMAKWGADVQHYLGFPDGIDGTDLLKRGHMQVARFHVEIIEDQVRTLKNDDDTFQLFAVKFYTEEGNYDLVGNDIPVFFIQDAVKFPDLVHAIKPEPHNEIPQAASAHDTFWDFISLMH